MGNDNTSFEDVLAAALGHSLPEERHIDPNVLVAYHERTLSPDDVNAVQEHLSECVECADLLRELGDFASEESLSAADGDVEETAWRALEVRIENERISGPPLETLWAPRSRRLWSPATLGLAASLLLAAAFGLRMASLQHQLDALREPQANVAIINLQPPGFSRGEMGEGTIRGEGERFVVILNPPAFPADAEHWVEIATADGTTVWTGSGFRPTEGGTFDLGLSRDLLRPAEYRIRLFRGEDPIAEFDLRVAP